MLNNYFNTFGVPLQTVGLQLLLNYILNNFYFPYFLINKIVVNMALTYLKQYEKDINLKI